MFSYQQAAFVARADTANCLISGLGLIAKIAVGTCVTITWCRHWRAGIKVVSFLPSGAWWSMKKGETCFEFPSVLWHCCLRRRKDIKTCAAYPENFSSRTTTTTHTHTHYNNCFTALFPGLPRWAGARINLLDFIVQGKITEAETLTIQLGATHAD